MPSEFGEPWRVEDTPEKCYIHDSDGKYICSPRLPAEALHPYNWREERSARIVACVNFLRAIPTEILQAFPDGADRVALLACQEYVERRKLNITGDQA